LALQFHFKPKPAPSNGLRESKVMLEVHNEQRPVYFTGIVAREARRGWVTLEISSVGTMGRPSALAKTTTTRAD
jgi:hypothetical protein